MSDDTGSTTYSYDGAGRLTSVAAPNGPLTYAYDLDGNRTSVAYPSAGNVAYTYTAAGRLATLSDWAARRTTYAYPRADRRCCRERCVDDHRCEQRGHECCVRDHAWWMGLGTSRALALRMVALT